MIKNVSVDPKIRSIIEEPIPRELIQEREAGRGVTLSYVSGAYVIDMLNRAFNYAWSWKIDKFWVQESIDAKKRVYDQASRSYTNEYKVEKQSPVAHVMGTLTVTLIDDNGERFEVSKTATGSKTILGGASEQESVFKSAGTDALKKAASLFGIGAPLYRNKDEQKYFNTKIGETYWTDEDRKKHKAELDYFDNLAERSGISRAELDNVVAAWSNNQYYTVSSLKPEQLVEFYKFFKQKMAQNTAK